MSDAADKAVAETLADEGRKDQSLSFTVPASGRRYTIWMEDWKAICAHIVIARAAAEKIYSVDAHLPQTKNR